VNELKHKSLFRAAFNRILHLVARLGPGATSLRPFLHRLRGVKVGSRVFIGDDVYLESAYPEQVEIRENVAISMRCVIVAHSKGHGRIILEKDSVIGVGSILWCPGGRELRIGEGAVIGAGSVITRSVPPRTLVASPPSEPIARLNAIWANAETYDQFLLSLTPIPKSERNRKDAAADSF
jgi:acetyltransferase-like isoleucine patch superfamily enzyme